jgi:RNA-binding protein YlmH
MATFQVDGELAAPVELAPAQRARSRERTAVVPSLRVDALGAKAFGVSREYFAKGIAAGRVRIDGRTVGKSAEADAGDAVWAEGLGRFRVAEVQGSTRRGNLKVRIEVEFDERG